MKKKKNVVSSVSDTKSKQNSKNKKTLLILIGISILFATVYFFLTNTKSILPYTDIIMIVYLSLLACSIFAYVFYNKGFTQKKITIDMLPSEWTDSAKKAFIDESKNRATKSKWLLYLIFPLSITFALDCILLFVVPFFVDLFS